MPALVPSVWLPGAEVTPATLICEALRLHAVKVMPGHEIELKTMSFDVAATITAAPV